MKRVLRRGVLGAALCAGVLAASCSEGSRSGPSATNDDGGERGTVRMLLQSTSASGKVYRLRQANFDVFGFTDGAAQATKTLHGDDDPTSPVVETLLAAGSYEVILQDGWSLEQVDSALGTSTRVDADLVNGPFQSFRVESAGETFVKYAFLVDGERITLGPPGRLIVGVTVTERTDQPPPAFSRRKLMENDPQALAAFSIRQAFEAAQVNANLPSDPELLYHQIIDSYASGPNGRLENTAHCGDETTDGSPSLNGYRIDCDRQERFQFDNFGSWFPTAVVNRVDLAPADGSNCGQQRMVFANDAGGRMFFIFEAQIPNPHPECGIDACRPLADFWSSLDQEPKASARGERLAQAFFQGTPELAAAGFGPFVALPHYSVGTGSVRTNNFDDSEWTLRQFKLMADPLGQSRAIPFPVSEAPFGGLWNDTAALPAGEKCRTSFLGAVDQLLAKDPAELGFVVDSACLDAESRNDFSQDYAFNLSQGSGAFRNQLEARLSGTGLGPDDLANRARFGGSCIGCHEEATGTSLGNGLIAPFSNGFVHVDESSQEDCGDGDSCFRISPALRDVFLPRRQRALDTLLASPGCGTVIGDGGAPSSPGEDAGAAIPPPVEPPPSSVITPDESVKDLVDEDQAAREALDGETLGGQPAGTNH